MMAENIQLIALATGEYEGLVGFNTWTAIFTLCNLVIVFLVGRKFLFGPVKKMIDDRQKEIDDMYSDAENDKKQAEEMKAEYTEKLENAKEQSEEIIKSSVRSAKLKEEEILRHAKEEAAATIKRADEQIAMERRQALNDIKNQVSDIAIDIAATVLERDIKKEEHSEMIDSFIDKLGDDND